MSAIIRLAKARPIAFGMGYSLMKTSGCDFMVQKVVEKREQIDWRRNVAFGSFGLFYLGGVQYFIYVPLFSRLFPNAASFAAKTVAEKVKDARGIRDLVAQVFLDQAVHHPLMYFPVFYMIKDFVTSDSPNPVRAVSEYAGNIKEDLVALWKVWIPSTFLNFAFMPMYARIPWVASTSLIWTCILSAMRGSSDVPASNVFVGVDHETMELVTRTVVGPAPRLDPTKAHVLLVVRGPDRPGVISSLAERLYQHGATVTTSKMLSLGDEFAIMCHASVEKEKLAQLTAAISNGLGNQQRARLTRSSSGLETFVDESDGLQISLRQIEPPSAAPAQPLFTAKLWLTGPDKPGLLFHLVNVCAEQGLNIEHLQTEQHAAGTHKGCAHLFSAHCHVCSDKVSPDVTLLRARLHELEKQLGCKCSLEVVQR